MGKKKADDKDLRIEVFIGEKGRRYRVTHIPSGVHVESDSAREAVDAINDGLNEA